MNITKAEYLPNELWLQVFSYLENVDLVYAFNMLNRRFQQIITPYFNDIDLSEVSLTQFNTIMKNILLSEQGYNICSLTLKNSGQFQRVFYPQGRYNCENSVVVLSKNIFHIQTLKLTIDHRIHENDFLQLTLPQLSSMSNLTDLHLNILHYTNMDNTFPQILTHLPSTLIKLTILGLWKQKYETYSAMEEFELPSNIKSFAFSTYNLKTIYKREFLLKTANNVEELKISFDEFDHFRDEYSNLQFSTSLITLHLELPLTKFEILAKFLKLFTNQLKTLILIIRTTIETTFSMKDELKNMIKDIFPVLETFKYTIYSPPSSDILKSTFDTIVLKFSHQLDFSNINFLKLHKLIYGLSSQPDNLNHDEISMLNNLFLTSPNLKWLELTADTSQILIELLKLIPTKTITKLDCLISSEFHELFLIDLAQIIPHIRVLSLNRVHYIKCRKIFRKKELIYSELLTAKTAIEHVQLYYKDLIHLYLYMASFDDTDYETYREHKQLEKWLDDEKQKKKFYSVYRLRSDYSEGYHAKYCGYSERDKNCVYINILL